MDTVIGINIMYGILLLIVLLIAYLLIGEMFIILTDLDGETMKWIQLAPNLLALVLVQVLWPMVVYRTLKRIRRGK